MNNNVLITQDELLKDNFNKQNISKSRNITEFLMYFTRILQLGIIAGLIGKDEFNQISNLLTVAIKNAIITAEDDDFEDNSIQIANYLYVITLYLQAKTNWEAWIELKSITTPKAANEFLENAKKWMLKQVTKEIYILESIKPSVQKLGLSNVTNCYNSIAKVLKNFMHFDNTTFSCDLKTYHKCVFQPGTYIFFYNDFENSPNFFEKICKIIHNFRIEVSIMFKINATNLAKSKITEVDDNLVRQQKKIDALNEEYSKKIKDLRNKYHKDVQYYLNSLHRPGRKKKGVLDEVELQKKYYEQKRVLEDELNTKLRKLEKLQEQQDSYMFEMLDPNYSLTDFIKEYAIWGLSQKGIIQYPTTPEERGKMLISIKTEVAVKQFIDMHKNLSNEEIEYLKQFKK